MFTTTMSLDEMVEEARRDYREIYWRVKIAYDEFCKNYRTYRGEKRRMIHSMVEEKQARTKQHNTWKVYFRYLLEKSGKAFTIGIIYIPIYRDSGTDYLYISVSRKEFQLNIMSAHFMQRYKERYLEYNHIDISGPNLITYYISHNVDRMPTYYIPKGWSEDDMKERCFTISSQGLSLVKFEHDYVLHITFLDQENLSRYKAMRYDEEKLWNLIKELQDVWEKREQGDGEVILLEKALYHKILSNPDSKKLFMSYIRRRKAGETPEVLKDYMKRAQMAWKELEDRAAHFENAWEHAERDLRPKTFWDKDDIKILRGSIELLKRLK